MKFIWKKTQYLLPLLALAVLPAQAMEKSNQLALQTAKKQEYLSLISNDGHRFWISPEAVTQCSQSQELHQELAGNKFIRTNLNEVTLRLLKDLIDAQHQRNDLATIIENHKEKISVADSVALMRESTKLQLPVITKAVAQHIYKTRPEFSLEEFEKLGKIDLSYAQLCALQTNDRTFILPEEVACACPYFTLMLNSSFKESRERIVRLPAIYPTTTVQFLKHVIECMYRNQIKNNQDIAKVKPTLAQMAGDFKDLCVETIALADLWQMPEVAHIFTQVLLQKKPEAIALISDHFHKYIPPFNAADADRLKEHALLYLEWIADAQKNNFFEKSQEELAQKLIDFIAENIDEYIATANALSVFKEPKMQDMLVMLNSQLLAKNKIKEDAPIIFQPYMNPIALMALYKINNTKFAVYAANENPKIYDSTGKHLATLRLGLRERLESMAVYPKKRHIFTASYCNGFWEPDNNVYLKQWDDSGNCIKTKTYSVGRPKIQIQTLDKNQVLLSLDNKRMIWDVERNELREADFTASRVACLGNSLVATCTQDDPNSYTLGLLNVADNTKTILKKAPEKCLNLYKLDDNHMLFQSIQGPFEIWNITTRICENMLDSAEISKGSIISKIDDKYFLLLEDQCALLYDDKKNKQIKNLTARENIWYNLAQTQYGRKERTLNALALDASHVVMASDCVKAHKIVIKQFNELLPIEEIIQKRNEQITYEQSSCGIM